jgi:hypothetical protein
MDRDIMLEVHSMRQTRERRAASEHERLLSMSNFILSTASVAGTLQQMLRCQIEYGTGLNGEARDTCLELERLIKAQYRELIGGEFGS